MRDWPLETAGSWFTLPAFLKFNFKVVKVDSKICKSNENFCGKTTDRYYKRLFL